MAVDTYDNLKTEIASHLERDDLTDSIDTFIDIAEARHKREIRIREMLTRSSLTVDDRYIDLPTGFLSAKILRLLTTPVSVLEYMNEDKLSRVRCETTGQPRFFTVHSQIEFDRFPDDAYSGEIIYFKSLTPLSGTDTTNALLTKAPDVYLYGALAASAPFLMHDERVRLWNELYEIGRDGVNSMDRRGVGPLVARAAGATP